MAKQVYHRAGFGGVNIVNSTVVQQSTWKVRSLASSRVLFIFSDDIK